MSKVRKERLLGEIVRFRVSRRDFDRAGALAFNEPRAKTALLRRAVEIGLDALEAQTKGRLGNERGGDPGGLAA